MPRYLWSFSWWVVDELNLFLELFLLVVNCMGVVHVFNFACVDSSWSSLETSAHR